MPDRFIVQQEIHVVNAFGSEKNIYQTYRNIIDFQRTHKINLCFRLKDNLALRVSNTK